MNDLVERTIILQWTARGICRGWCTTMAPPNIYPRVIVRNGIREVFSMNSSFTHIGDDEPRTDEWWLSRLISFFRPFLIPETLAFTEFL